MSQWCKEVSNRKRAEGNITYVFACRCYVYLVEELVGTMNAALENFDVLGGPEETEGAPVAARGLRDR